MATCPGWVGDSLASSRLRAALCSPLPRRRCLPNLAASAGGSCTFLPAELSFLGTPGSGLRNLKPYRMTGGCGAMQRTGV